MKKFKMWMLAQRIERKWKQIGRNRKEMEALVAQRIPYTSDRLVRLDAETAELGCSARALEKQYRMLEQGT